MSARRSHRKRYSITVNAGAKQLPAKRADLLFPPLKEIVPPLIKALSSNFKNVEVKEMQCPDLTTWCGLAEKGLSGETRICDVGGVSYLMDPQYHHITYQLPDVLRACKMAGVGLIIGAAAASPLVVGKNAQLIPNTLIPGPRHTRFVKLGYPPKEEESDDELDEDMETPVPSGTKRASLSGLTIKEDKKSPDIKVYKEKEPVARIRSPSSGTPVASDPPAEGDTMSPRTPVKSDDDEKVPSKSVSTPDERIMTPQVGFYPSEETGCFANLFMSQGKPGPVIYIKVSVRTGKNNLTNTIREGLKGVKGVGGEKQMGMGGVFKVNKGRVKAHIMPDFNPTKMDPDDSKTINEWLKFYEMGPDLTMFTTFLTDDPTPDNAFHLQLERTHFYGTGKDHHEGGQYRHDVTPEIIEYEGYFNLAEYLYRVDDPDSKDSEK